MLCTSLLDFVNALQNVIKMSADKGNTYTLLMFNTAVSLFSIVLLCITAAQGRKRLHLNNERLTSYPVINDIDGICKTMVETQGYTCEEHKVIVFHLPPIDYERILGNYFFVGTRLQQRMATS